MILTAIESKWDAFRQKLLNWQNKRRNGQLMQDKSANERSIGLLQKRYGYTREQATSELSKHYSKARLG